MVVTFNGWSQDYETLPYFLNSEYKLVEGGVEVDELPQNYDEIAARFSPNTAQWMAKQVRKQRDMLLAETDWTQVGDSPLRNAPEWIAYRSALRDLPLQTGFPWSVDWPVRPT